MEQNSQMVLRNPNELEKYINSRIHDKSSNTGFQKINIQSAFSIDDSETRKTEILPLQKTGYFFRKIVITDGNQEAWSDEEGIMYMGVIPFLLDKNMLH